MKVKGNFRQVYQVRSLTVLSLCQGCRSCQPSRVSSHYLHNAHKTLAVLQAEAVPDDLFYRGSDIFGSASIAWGVVRQRQVIVNGLRASDKAGRMSGHDSVVGKLLDRVHRVISADVNKGFDIQLVKDRKDFLIDSLVLMDLRQLKAAGPKECRRGPLQELRIQLRGDIF